MRPEVIIRVPYPKPGLALLEKDFTVHYVPTPEEFENAVDSHPEARALVTNASFGVTGDEIRRLPKLEIVLNRGVGLENVDLAAMKKRGVVLTTGKGTNAFSVADHAMALLLASARKIVWADRQVHAGAWLESRDPVALAWKRRLGILGLGEIGQQIAQRAEGFSMAISYHNRNKRHDVGYAYSESPLELAKNSDFIVVALPGGTGTEGLVNAEFLDALGPDGYLINIGRGTTVDTGALIQALNEKRIAGAAIDVVAGEPVLPKELLDAPNLIITPHMAARSIETQSESLRRVLENLKAHFAGGPLASRIV